MVSLVIVKSEMFKLVLPERQNLYVVGTYVLYYYTNVYFANGIKNGVSKM